MSSTVFAQPAAISSRRIGTRAVIILALLAGAAYGIGAGLAAPKPADIDLVHLLRAMAVLKLAFVAAAAGAILWRLQAPVRPGWLAGYAAMCAAMAAGPGLIWFSAHMVAAAILLHVGLAAAVVLLWQDRVTAELLAAAVHRRRLARRG